jgi:hypothetical protein
MTNEQSFFFLRETNEQRCERWIWITGPWAESSGIMESGPYIPHKGRLVALFGPLDVPVSPLSDSLPSARQHPRFASPWPPQAFPVPVQVPSKKASACGISSSRHLAKHLPPLPKPSPTAQAPASRSPLCPWRRGRRRGSSRPPWSSSTAPSTSSPPPSTATVTSPPPVSVPPLRSPLAVLFFVPLLQFKKVVVKIV